MKKMKLPGMLLWMLLWAAGGMAGGSCMDKIPEVKVAEINGKELLLSEVKDIFPSGISADDSLALLRNYVNNWARKQLIAGIAEQHLTKEQKDVSQELEDYRLSLLIFRYEKLYLERRFDTLVSDVETDAFYNAAPQNFILDKPIAKALFIKVAEDIPQIRQIDRLYRSSRTEDREALSRICSNIAEIYTDFDERWINAEFLAETLPVDSKQIEAGWDNGFFTAEANGYKYYVHLYEMRTAGAQAPVEYERENIARIIRNRRHREMLKNLENTIFNNALNHNQLKIYIDE
ncbi:MAG: hypothetical protein LBD91_01075 [Prevotellaceae bacterium]|nr:hypothetical protein [Prevotellaceae bacterium]